MIKRFELWIVRTKKDKEKGISRFRQQIRYPEVEDVFEWIKLVIDFECDVEY